MRRLHWWGWILFLASSLLYLTLGFRDGDWLMVAGSVAFVIGVLLLMAPDRAAHDGDTEPDERDER